MSRPATSRHPRSDNGRRAVPALAAALAAGLLAACSSDAPPEAPADPAASGGDAEAAEFFEEDEYQRQLALAGETPEGPADRPWEQMLRPEPVSTEEYAIPDAEVHLCFSNAGVFNPWRQVGLTTMEAEVAQHPEIGEFTVLDAEGKDDKQISDIQQLSTQDCDLLIVSPNTTATLTPAVEEACQRLPVIVFDRGVNTDCPVTFVHPVGGYAYGAAAADFLVERVEPGGKILALRISPGVDVLENRWSAAELAFEESELEVADVRFTEGDPAVAKAAVTDAIQRHGTIDGVWMDSGATAVAAVEAFEDAGLPVPPITGEDQQDFLQAWADRDLTAIAPGYPTFQWRTPVIAALKVLRGEPVPGEWVLPQPVITEENRDAYLDPELPPLHYALCGCADLPGYPGDWGGR
ncbi:substrate-binding domain-containing protein [Streptomyces sp. DSM 44915]|uniref:Substrate-binding domain-containing protein n=1 Tax=Streptomyces chisholmiae TaxID=3075540 RepID=A0ABU2K0A2_9ACTN|nr:substrate-binding domain-containing protein [Streptomyces sp. DSM 44915]MDT0269888.1 substrate-binding domain-containing protein [Streptomyces sp. DSM 44915]